MQDVKFSVNRFWSFFRIWNELLTKNSNLIKTFLLGTVWTLTLGVYKSSRNKLGFCDFHYESTVIPCIFPITSLIIAPSEPKFISALSCSLFTIVLTYKKIDQIVINTVDPLIYLKTFTCLSAGKCITLIFKRTLHLDLPHFMEPTIFFPGGGILHPQGCYLFLQHF